MKFNKAIALLIASIMMLSLVTACAKKDEATTDTGATGNTESTSDATSDASSDAGETLEPITYTMFIGSPGEGALTPDNKIMKKIEEEFGITFEIEYLVGDLDQKTGVMIASGDYPDIIVSNNTDQFIDAGAYTDLKPFISEEKTPNIASHYDGLAKKN